MKEHIFILIWTVSKILIIPHFFNSSRKGSLIVDFWFSITWPLRSGDLIEIIKGILEKNGSIHMLPVDPQYFPHDTGEFDYDKIVDTMIYLSL